MIHFGCSTGEKGNIPREIQYFSGWSGYSLPVTPQNPINYVDAEKLDAILMAGFYENGTISVFVKWLVQRDSISPDLNRFRDEVNLLVKDSTNLFFYKPVENPDGTVTPGDRLELNETKELMQYFKLQYLKDDSRIALFKVNRTKMFKHEYTYWPNGKLKKMKATENGGKISLIVFDENGNKIRENVVEE